MTIRKPHLKPTRFSHDDREGYTQWLNVRMQLDVKETFLRIAKALDFNPSTLARRILKQWVKQNEHLVKPVEQLESQITQEVGKDS